MTFSATVSTLLIAAPSDLPAEDFDTILHTIVRWNGVYGPRFDAIINPIHWQAHAAPEFGLRPQESLNRQLVDQADAVLAIFWHRLGTPTGESESGTTEEIRRAHAAGKYVAILRCDRQESPEKIDAQQLESLNHFLQSIKAEGLYLTYGNAADLATHIDIILTELVSRHRERGIFQLLEPSPKRADVRPSVIQSERAESDRNGRQRIKRTWRLVLHNAGDAPARNVRFTLELEEGDAKDLPSIVGADKPLEALAPEGDAPYPMLLHGGVADQVRCIVTWVDDSGEHKEATTLRLL